MSATSLVRDLKAFLQFLCDTMNVKRSGRLLLAIINLLLHNFEERHPVVSFILLIWISLITQLAFTWWKATMETTKTHFMHCSGVFIAEFEKVNARLEVAWKKPDAIFHGIIWLDIMNYGLLEISTSLPALEPVSTLSLKFLIYLDCFLSEIMV